MTASLEERIVEWSASRPAWQRAVLRRVALGDAFSAKDYDQLTDALVGTPSPPMRPASVMRSIGNSRPALRIAAGTRSRLSSTVESGKPTVLKVGATPPLRLSP